MAVEPAAAPPAAELSFGERWGALLTLGGLLFLIGLAGLAIINHAKPAPTPAMVPVQPVSQTVPDANVVAINCGQAVSPPSYLTVTFLAYDANIQRLTYRNESGTNFSQGWCQQPYVSDQERTMTLSSLRGGDRLTLTTGASGIRAIYRN